MRWRSRCGRRSSMRSPDTARSHPAGPGPTARTQRDSITARESEMATSSFLNPLELWRTGLTKLEAELNTLATGSLKQEPVVHALHRLTTLSLGVHRIC